MGNDGAAKVIQKREDERARAEEKYLEDLRKLREESAADRARAKALRDQQFRKSAVATSISSMGLRNGSGTGLSRSRDAAFDESVDADIPWGSEQPHPSISANPDWTWKLSAADSEESHYAGEDGEAANTAEFLTIATHPP